MPLSNPDPYYSYQSILERMLARIPDTFDKREGSLVFDALAPAALELAFCYLEISALFQEAFPDTASREYLIRHVNEIGLMPYPKTHAIYRIKTTPGHVDVAIGERFSFDKVNIEIVDKESPGVYIGRAEEGGSQVNSALGDIIPIGYIDGLQTAKITELVIPGEDEEDTEALRERYFAALRYKSFGGNVAQYKEETMKIEGVGGVKVTPVWKGGGTVLLTIMDAQYKPPSPELLEYVQTAIDPPVGSGHGLGIAPIGHAVTVQGCEAKPIDIGFNLAYQPGWDWDRLRQDAEAGIDAYFTSLRQTWDKQDAITVRVSQIEMRMLDLDGVLDIEGTTINGQEANLTLDPMEIPERGAINATTTN